MHNNIFSSAKHTNPITRRDVVCFQPSVKKHQAGGETHRHLYFFMDVPDERADPKDVEITEGQTNTAKKQ